MSLLFILLNSNRGKLSSDNYFSPSSDSYFSPVFGGINSPWFVVLLLFWFGSAAAGLRPPGVGGRRPAAATRRGGVAGLIVGDSYGGRLGQTRRALALSLVGACAVTVAVKFQNDGVVDQSIDGRHRRHGILKDLFPLTENQVGTD